MTFQPNLQNQYGRRLLPSVFDQIATTNPNRFYACLPVAGQVSQGYQDITFQQVKAAVDHLAWSIFETYGRSQDFATICYIGEPDLRTAVMFLAAVKCGYKVLLVSPRNPVSTNIFLMKQTCCKIVYYSALMNQLVGALKGVMTDVSFELLNPWAELIGKKPKHFEFSKTFENAVNDPILVLHSSGSTDIPKPITMTHGTLATIDASHNLRDIPGRKRHDFTLWNIKPFGRFYSVFPPFHIAGFLSTVTHPIYSDAAVPVLSPSLLPPNGTMVLEILQSVEIAGLFVVPSIIEQMAKIPGSIEILHSLRFICYAGGPLAPAVGDQLCRHVDLCQFYGSTETIAPPQLVMEADDWQYMEWHPDFKGVMEPSDDDAFELVYHYKDLDPHETGVVHSLPNLEEYRTKDLFRQHQSKPGLWRFHGRKDDIIVLANGEKFNPVPMEIALSGISSISGAIVVGQGKSQASLLLEASEPTESGPEWIEKIWPDVEKANTLLPSQGRITKSRIIMASSAKPFARAGKGTVIRKLTIDLYKDELETLYNSLTVKKVQRTSLKARFDLQDVQELVSSIFISVLSERTLNHDDNLFAAGIDSLKSLEALELLKAEIYPYAKDNDLKWLDVQLLYSHASLDDMSAVISDFLNNGMVPVPSNSPSVSIKELVEKFTSGLLSVSPAPTPVRKSKDLTVGILGSRGFLGSAILHSFLHDTAVANIVCMDRTSSQVVPQKINGHSKLQYMPIDYTKKDLGLSQQSLEEILGQVDILVFNAWPVDFNLPLQAFTSNLQALRHLLDIIATTSKQRPTSGGSPYVVFISSIAAANALSQAGLSTGYGQSKFVAEQLLAAAAQSLGVCSSILRVGQVTPASQSSVLAEAKTWPTKEWFPALCKASQTLWAFPDDFGALDWIPVDSIGNIVKEIALHHSTQPETQISHAYTIVNPHTVPWNLVVDEMKRNASSNGVSNADHRVQFVPLADWIAKAESYQQTNGANQLQAIKLLPFFRGLLSVLGATPVSKSGLTATKTELDLEMPNQAVSPTFAGLKAISQSEIQDWIRHIFSN